MPREDAQRWNQRYLDRDPGEAFRPQRLLAENADLLPSTGLALDIAMGMGGSAGFILEHGLGVVGVDISSVAVRLAKHFHPDLQAVIADLTRFHIPPDRFDLILNFYYLQRDLWPLYEQNLQPGGLLFLETFQENSRPEPAANPDHLLHPGELLEAFPSLEILHYQEGLTTARSGRMVPRASLIARKPKS